MRKAARAIIIENGKLLTMFRDKYNSKYYTLVGGGVHDGETLEAAVRREVKEETGLQVISERLVFIEEHPEPYNQQYIFLCEVAAHDNVAVQSTSEEGMMNRIGINIHEPRWVDVHSIRTLEFRSPALQQAIADALVNGFPAEPVKL